MAAVEGTPRRVKTLLSSFLQSPSTEQDTSQAQIEDPESSASMCQPRSREAFWTRVETFSPFTWFAKPLELSPLHCALYGWENADVDILRCVSCKVCVDATMSANWDPVMFSKSCHQLKDSLVSGHSKLCPWPDNPCPETFVQLPVYTPHQWNEDFVTRWQSLLSLGTNLPLLDDHAYREMDEVSEDHIDGLQTMLQTPVNSKHVLKISSLIALCGWHNRNNDSGIDNCTLFCTMCRREVGLWNFKTINQWDESDKRAPQDRSTTKSPSMLAAEERYHHPNTSKHGVYDESMDVCSQGGSAATGIGDDEQYRSFAGCKRTNTGLRNMPSQRTDVPNSSDIEECMDIEERLKLYSEKEQDEEERHQNKTKSQFDKIGSARAETGVKRSDSPLSLTEVHAREGTSKETLLMKRFVTGRESPIRGRHGADSLPYRSPLHLSISDLSEKEHCESLCVEVEEESLTDKLQAVESELEFMAGGLDGADKEDYAPDIKRIRLEDLEQTKFNPLSEHRSWCPWVTCGMTDQDRSQNQQEPGNGWRMLLHTILPSLHSGRVHCFTDVPPKEAWKPVRRLLNECSSSNGKKGSPTATKN